VTGGNLPAGAARRGPEPDSLASASGRPPNAGVTVGPRPLVPEDAPRRPPEILQRRRLRHVSPADTRLGRRASLLVLARAARLTQAGSARDLPLSL
jgi:hypothetical protein